MLFNVEIFDPFSPCVQCVQVVTLTAQELHTPSTGLCGNHIPEPRFPLLTQEYCWRKCRTETFVWKDHLKHFNSLHLFLVKATLLVLPLVLAYWRKALRYSIVHQDLSKALHFVAFEL